MITSIETQAAQPVEMVSTHDIALTRPGDERFSRASCDSPRCPRSMAKLAGVLCSELIKGVPDDIYPGGCGQVIEAARGTAGGAFGPKQEGRAY